jgi:hypothetical protein
MRTLVLCYVLCYQFPFVLCGPQAAVACVFAMVSLVAFAITGLPLKDSRDMQIYIVGCAIIFLSTFLALMIKVDTSNENTQSSNVMSVLLIVLNVVMAVAALAQCALIATHNFDSAKDNSVYGLRSRHSEEKVANGKDFGEAGAREMEEAKAPGS